jgi:hypothetical protein
MCGDTFIVTGDTEIARQRALRDWERCCVPNALAATDDPVVAGATNPTPRSSLLSGKPSWVRRRIAHWPFDAPDYTT